MQELGGDIPTRRQLDADPNAPSREQICRFYPTFNDALLDACGKVNMKKDNKARYPDKEMKKEAEAMFEELGRAPTCAEWDANPRTCKTSVLEKRHGSYNKAMKIFGIQPNKKGVTLNHPRKKQGVIDGDNLTPKVKKKIEAIIKVERRRLKEKDLGVDGLPTPSYFYQHGWSMEKLNQYIGAEKVIRTVLLPNEKIDPGITAILQGFVQAKQRKLRWEDFTKNREDGMPSSSYFRKRNINRIDIINAIIEADVILGKLHLNN